MQEKRVTQREVAAAAGVTRPTVSLALRHHPAIPKDTRDRILAIAAKLGYTPDPVLSALASYRWPLSSGKRATQSIALIEFIPDHEVGPTGYPNEVRRGAIDRATALGFTASTFRMPNYDGNIKRLLRVIHSRGINGVILLPFDKPLSLDLQAGWESFSVVTATSSVLAPRFHQVMPNQLHNMTTLLERMHRLGHTRIGGIFSEAYEQRTIHAYSMALAWFGHRDRILILPTSATEEENRRRITKWLQTHQLDLVFAPNADGLARLARPTRQSRALRFTTPGDYLEQFPVLIGETAVRVLSGLMYDNETGIPTHPQITTIDGVLRDHLLAEAGA
jgi:DNA-binding LacI/PurR family transcriptional regulator